ncbi:6-phosphogluconolactonase [Jeongeupia naejangsanensis]|uniref:6-phosphogluconolactonase n=1 Tax=Jeongeupia naejangsanensis TaxID=613195 RepID=A0ABS2BHT0_9NEIS|nr:6-phosphogluconolactonase [Jeongeupia naejangsanensis]MBM3115167.1 6-phosphogluconolactonase [Jeongeupia naejangsanensis]
MSLQWHEFASKAQLDTALANHIADRLKAAIDARGAASLAVSGGRTPAGMFAALAQAAIDWRRVNITLVDERWVQPDHADSNERSVREHLLQGPAAQAHFISLVNGAATPHEALTAIEARLAIFPSPIDVLILGMGDDGHTASLFPNAAELEAACASEAQLAAVTPPVAPHQRITLTLPTIAKAREVIVHITGDSKKALLQTALGEDKPVPLQYPIRRVLDRVTTGKSVFWTA